MIEFWVPTVYSGLMHDIRLANWLGGSERKSVSYFGVIRILALLECSNSVRFEVGEVGGTESRGTSNLAEFELSTN